MKVKQHNKSKVMQYKDVDIITKDEALKIIEEGSVLKICDALLGVVLHSSDWKWCQNQCLNLLNHQNIEVQSLAATCLGHIARIHKKIDKPLVIKVLNAKLKDPLVSGAAQDALDDIEIFIQ